MQHFLLLSTRLDSLPFDLCLEGVGLVGWERLGWCDYFTLFLSSSCWEALHCSMKLCREKVAKITRESNSMWKREPLWATLHYLWAKRKTTAELSPGKPACWLPPEASRGIGMQQSPSCNSLVWPLWSIWDGLHAVCSGCDIKQLSYHFLSAHITNQQGKVRHC